MAPRVGICACCDRQRPYRTKELCANCYKAVWREERKHRTMIQTVSAAIELVASPGDPEEVERLVAQYALPPCRVRYSRSWECEQHRRPILECLNAGIQAAQRQLEVEHARLLKILHAGPPPVSRGGSLARTAGRIELSMRRFP